MKSQVPLTEAQGGALTDDALAESEVGPRQNCTTSRGYIRGTHGNVLLLCNVDTCKGLSLSRALMHHDQGRGGERASRDELAHECDGNSPAQPRLTDGGTLQTAGRKQSRPTPPH